MKWKSLGIRKAITMATFGIDKLSILLEAKKITVRFGGLHALQRVDFQVKKGDIYGLIGPNGAGKSTFINVVTGIYKPEEGSILFENQPIQGIKSHIIAQLGIARTFQALGLFPKMTVLENLLIGLHGQLLGNVFSGSLRLPGIKKLENEGQRKALEMLAYLGLTDIAERKPVDLPFGHSKIIELGRALLTDPKLLLLDEPTSGLSADESKMIMEAINKIRSEKGVTVLLIEHNIPFVQSISDIVGVLNFGIKIAEGKPEEILSNPQVVEAYLGKKDGNIKD